MKVYRFSCIVEGHGETAALPVLLRRLAKDWRTVHVEAPCPIRVKRDRFIKRPDELTRCLELAAKKLMGAKAGCILILLDSEGGCPATLGRELLDRSRQVRPDQQISVVLAHQEFESWFLAAAGSLRGQRRLVDDLAPPPDAEAVASAKEWLTARMKTGKYAETLDQPALAALFDMEAAYQGSRSFRKLAAEVRDRLQVFDSSSSL